MPFVVQYLTELIDGQLNLKFNPTTKFHYYTSKSVFPNSFRMFDKGQP